MTTSAMFENSAAAADAAELDLDVKVAGISPDAVFGVTTAAKRGAGVTEGSTSPSTYGVMSRCPTCCC